MTESTGNEPTPAQPEPTAPTASSEPSQQTEQTAPPTFVPQPPPLAPAAPQAAETPQPQVPETPQPWTAYPPPAAEPAYAPADFYGQASTDPYGHAVSEPYGTDTLTIPASAPAASAAGLPPYGDQSPSDTATSPRRRGRTVALVLATALVAGGIGGATGALVANRDDQTSSVTSLTGSGTSGTSTPVTLPTGSVEAAAAKVLPSVVVITERGTDGSGGEGSGIILSSDGLILTNNHVVSESVNGGTLQVTLPGNKTVDATIVGRDPSSDLAVVRAKGVTGLTPATLGSSGALVVGQTVVAVGSPLGLSGTVTSGIVSALNRPVTTGDDNGGQNPFGQQQAQSTAVLDAIQTDAAINPGNSGGPLVDLAGRVVGINSAIASLGTSSASGQSGSIGLGFAIPIDQAKRIAQELIAKGTATHPQLGVQVTDATTGDGAVLRTVTPGGPADKAGLKAGDVVTAVNGLAVDNADDLIAHVRSQAPGATVKVTYIRDGKTATVDVTLGEASSS
jgi:putative serine protease PepD